MSGNGSRRDGSFDPYRHALAGRGERRNARALPRLVRSAFRLARDAGPRLLAGVIAIQVATALLLGAQVVLGKLSIQAILDESGSGGSVAPVLIPLGAFAIAAAIAGLLASAQTHLQRLLGEKVQKVTMGRLLGVTTGVPLADFETPEFFDDLQRVKVNALMRPLTLVTGLVQVTGGTLAVVGLGITVALIAPELVAILILGGLPLAWLSRRSGQAEFGFATRTTASRRRRYYLETLLTGRDEAKEVRAFELAEPLRRRWEDDYTGYFAQLDRHVRHRLLLDVASAVVAAVATGAALWLLGWMIVDGAVPLATAGAALIAVRLLGGRLQQVFSGVSGLFESALFLRDLERFLGRDGARVAARSGHAEAGTLQELRAHDVRFRYPGSDREVLGGVSIAVRAGETVALVGENGSGKTTLAKLLTGLFEPTEGRIEWNGTDARELDVTSVRRQIGVIFQDFVRYQLPARENIGLGRADADADLERIVAAARRGGAHEVIEGLPEGYETTLGKEFAGGQDLSGGQWQRVALARAFFRDAPMLLLDEPTAALDARSEHEVFQRVRELAAGRGVLLISHRFSTVRFADRIHVLDDGHVIEEGSHDELMALGGRYAEMFRLQAAAYG
jgi:ATP-binding cassette subfamily B protein